MSDNGKGKVVKLYKDKLGQRQYTLGSLRELIEDQFQMETEGRTDILSELDTREKRITAVMEVADYVLATEYINLPTADKRHIVEEVVANLFYFGALDRYLRDSEITEMTIEGVFNVAVRRGFGEMKNLESPFGDLPDLERVLTRALAPAGAVLLESDPFLEVGTKFYDRPVRFSIIAPPISPLYSVQIRFHPAVAFTMDDLIPDVIPDAAADLMQQTLAAGRGLIVTGEVGVGKTTLIAALLNAKENHDGVVVVERAAEMQLPDSLARLATIPAKPDMSAVDFESQIVEAIEHHLPRTLVMDEIRGDESLALWQGLTAPDVAQPIIAFRGTSNPARLYSAVSMAIRKRQFSLESDVINPVLLEKLPFVAALHRDKSDTAPYLSLFGQWVELETGSGLSIQPLVTWDGKSEPVRSDYTPRLS